MRGVLAALLIVGLAFSGSPVGAASGSTTKKSPPKSSSTAKNTKAKPDQNAKPAKDNSKADASKNKDAKPSAPAKPAPKPEEQPSSAKKDSPDPPAATVCDDCYTSLVIDATALKLDKAMSPKILRKDGSEVWGTLKDLKDEDYDILQDRGMVGYVITIEEARSNSRCGPRPLVVRAVDTHGSPLCSDPVVCDEDAGSILAENAKGKFLEKFDVIFIKNENPAPPPAEPDGDKPSSTPPPDPQPQPPQPPTPNS